MAGVDALIMPAVTVKVPEIAPCATVTLAGTLAAPVLELESETVAPPVPAAVVKLTVPVAVLPLTIVLGLTDTLLSAADAGGGLMVTPDVTLAPEYVAVKVTEVDVLTVPALTVNVPEVAPCGIVTLEETLAATLLELESDTTTPPLGAACVRVTVPVPI